MQLNFLVNLMNEQTKILAFIKEKFPGQNERINQLYEEDENFRSLCSDYFSSVESLKNFHAFSEENKHSIEEYKSVIEELEKEFYNFIFSKL